MSTWDLLTKYLRDDVQGEDYPGHLVPRVLIPAAGASALGFMLLPDMRVVGDAAFMGSILRCVVAACVAGLLVVRPNPPFAASAVAVAGSVLGAVVVGVVAPGGLDAGGVFAGLALGALLASFVSLAASLGWGPAAAAGSVGLLVVILMLAVGVLPGVVDSGVYADRQTNISAPRQPEGYRNDGSAFLRTYELMRAGWGYYPAFQQGITDHAGYDADYLKSPFNYREPFIFYLWRVLPGESGADVWRWFVVFAALQMICAYILAASLAPRGVALLAPAALVAWFFFMLWQSSWFALIEVWAGGFGLAAVTLLMRRRVVPSLVLLTAAVAAREFMVVLVPAWILVWWIAGHQRSKAWVPVGAVGGPFLVLLLHFLSVPRTQSGFESAASWTHGGIDRLMGALEFGYGAMPAGESIALLVGLAALAGAATQRPAWRSAALLSATVLPTLFLLVFSGGRDGYPWGAVYTPLAIAIAPSALALLFPEGTTREPVVG